MLDIYHYVLFENVDEVLEPQDIDAYISSSGVLSRNSWLLTKLGKLPDDLSGIPVDWAARSSDAPAFLAKMLSRCRYDLGQVRDFFEEGRALARVILRDFYGIPEMFECITNSCLLYTSPSPRD